MRYFHSAEVGLPDDVWAPFAEGRKPDRYEPGRLIYLQGTVANRFYYILRGKAKAFISSEGGHERILNIYRAGDLMGEASFFDRQPRVSSSMALTRCELVPIDEETVRRRFSEHPELAMAMLRYLARTVRLLSGHVDDISFLSADRRIARLLVTLQRDEQGLIRSSQEEIGFAAGVSWITVSRVLLTFVRKGWLKTGYRTTEITDLDALLNFASG
jgi:CRP/FNR family transcriptional regulator